MSFACQCPAPIADCLAKPVIEACGSVNNDAPTNHPFDWLLVSMRHVHQGTSSHVCRWHGASNWLAMYYNMPSIACQMMAGGLLMQQQAWANLHVRQLHSMRCQHVHI